MDGEIVSFPNQNQMLSNQQSYNAPSQNNKKRIVLSTIIFVIILLVLLLGILKYFNIISLSKLYPNQLDSLPRKDFSQPSSQQLTPPDSITNPTEEAKETFTTFLPPILLPYYTPQKSDISIKPVEIEQNSFTVEWHQEQVTFTADFALSPDRIMKRLIINIIVPEVINPSAESAEESAYQFFSIKPEGQWICNANECDNFWIGKDEIKRGINLSSQLDIGDNKKGTVITFCEYTKDTPLYKYSLNSCFSR